MTSLKLHWQILIAMAIGIVIGGLFQYSGTDLSQSNAYAIITSLGTIFVRLLKMIIVPLIFTSIITGVAGIGDGSKLGRLGVKTLLYYITTSLFAIVIGLTLTNLIQPGVGVNLPTADSFDASKLNTPGSPAEILIRMIPLNPISAAAKGDMLGLIFFAIFLGAAITQLKGNHKSQLTSFFESLFQAIMRMTEIIIKFAPIGVLGLITKTVATSGFEMFAAVGIYMLTIATGLSIHILVVLPFIFFLLTRINPIIHFKAMASAMATAFSTSSSSATLPVTMRCVRENAGVSNETSSFVLPMGATVNMDGTALYVGIVSVFAAQAFDIPLSLTDYLLIAGSTTLVSVGTAAVPGASIFLMSAVMDTIGMAPEQIGLVIGFIFAIDRPLDMLRTSVNVAGDLSVSTAVANWEGEFDREIFDRKLKV